MKRPLGVLLISYFYILGAIFLLYTSVFFDANANQIKISTRFGVPNVPEQLMRVLVALTSLIMAIGYMRLRTWGFWMVIGYSVILGSISFSLTLSHNQQPFIGNMNWSIIVLIYTIFVRKAFFQNQKLVKRETIL